MTKPTGRKEGRPKGNFSTARDRYLIGAFWATFIHERVFNGNPKANKHAIAMTYAMIECGELCDSPDNEATILKGEGELKWRSKIMSSVQLDARAHKAKKRADDIIRKSERAMELNPSKVSMMISAFTAAYYEQNRDMALGLACAACEALSEKPFFEKSLKPFIEGRFDPSKRVVFSLPEFLPNFLNPKP